MGVFLLLMGVGLCNVGLGYALAVALGHGPRSLREAWIALGSETRSSGLEAPNDQTRFEANAPILDSSAPVSLTTPLCTNTQDESSLAKAEYGGGAT